MCTRVLMRSRQRTKTNNMADLTEEQAIDAQARRIKAYRASIRGFIKAMWKLEPQPVKPEYREQWERVTRTTGQEWERAKKTVRADWFGDPVDPTHRGGDWIWYDFVKGRHYTWQQHLILLGIEKAVARNASSLLSVVSGHGIGKSATCTWVILWFLYCFMESQVGVTAPTSHQMHDVLWKELSIWINKMPEDDRELYEWTSEYVRMNYAPASWFARARTSSKENTEALAGVHSESGVLLVADEASGIYQQVFDTMEGALTGKNIFMLLISNGTQATGYFFDTQHKSKHNWQNFGFNGEESPIVDRAFIELKAKHGLDSEEYKIRVKGGFPGENMADNSGYMQLIPEARITVRLKGLLDVPFIGRKILGIDPSGEGKDEATFVIRDRFKAECVLRLPKADDKIIAERALTFMAHYNIAPEDVVVGAFGVGANVAKEIAIASAKMKGGPYEIYSVMEGNKPDEEEHYNWKFFRRHADEITNPEENPKEFVDLYLNIRALMYFRTRAWFFGGGALVDVNEQDSDFKNEFLYIAYKRSLQGNKIQLKSKREMNKEGIKSPNMADGLSLTMLRDLDDNVQYATADKEDEDNNDREPDDDRFNAL